MELGLSDLASLGLLVLSIVMLTRGADSFVESAARIARRLNISELVIGLTLVSFGTSAPELAVSVGAALTGRDAISVSNIVGSNIFNLGIILGLCGCLVVVQASKKLVWRDMTFLIGVSCGLFAALSDGVLERWEGVVMLSLLVGYLTFLVKSKEEFHVDNGTKPATWRDGPKLFAGLALILVGAHFLVESASVLARSFGVSEWVIGLTIVAAGTSAPELVTALSAIRKGRHGISAGALVGSDIYNVLGVLGTAAVITPLNIEASALPSVGLMLGATVLVWIFFRTGWSIGRREGIILVLVGLFRWYYYI
ncbi:MAG: calcium/sodium antiporter [Myxococcota bacterium]|nr:calcium/sodium antiporter [Myxococcota bacterium]